MKQVRVVVALICLCASMAMHHAGARDAPRPTSVINVDSAQLHPDYWIARERLADVPVLDRDQIAAQNRRLLATDPSMHDIEHLPASLDAGRVLAWIEALSSRPTRTLHDVHGKVLTEDAIDGLLSSLDLDAIAAALPTRYGLVVHRADLRTFPTTLRVFSTNDGDTDIDRFQESALFPGTPVVIAHHSRDGQWLFVVSQRYAAWIEQRLVAEGSREQVLGYAARTPYRLVTGAKVHTVYSPGNAALSELQLEMGVRIPLTDPAPEAAVDGQNPYASWVIELPVRQDNGALAFAPALLPRTADTTDASLPLTRANIIRQSFKFLGERYGWGHDYNGRDCSGFVSEVYRSMGVVLPRNTGDQATSPALQHTTFDGADGRGAREAAVAALDVGDLVYIPGHVMLVIGHIDGAPWVIHDIQGGRIIDVDGQLRELHLNSVAVTPLMPLMFDDSRRFVDGITSIVRIGAR